MPPNADAKACAADPTPDGGTVWREDEGVSLRVPKFYPPSARHLAKLLARTDVPPLGTITMAEVAKHNARDDLWVIVDGKAYDVTPYVEQHPGGWLPMVNMGGKDCTDAFANYHPARVYKQMLPHYFVGDVVDYQESDFVKVTDYNLIKNTGVWVAQARGVQ
jgi:cytochrome b involved in lipid metabolism